MLIKEYRIPLPMTVEEYRIAQLYMIQKKSRIESHGAGSGVEIVENRPYEEGPGGSGQYTYKIYHVGSHLPSWFRAILPASALVVYEEAWNAYPYTRTRYTTPFVERFSLDIETRYFDDHGNQPNVFRLQGPDHRDRIVDLIDVVKDGVGIVEENKDDDPKVFRSVKTGRGPLGDEWIADCVAQGRPIMCAYKLCRVEFRYWGMQSKIEKFIHDIALRRTMLRAHRQAWVWQDEWYGLTIEDIRELEKEAQEALAKTMAEASQQPAAAAEPASPTAADDARRESSSRSRKADGETLAGQGATSRHSLSAASRHSLSANSRRSLAGSHDSSANLLPTVDPLEALKRDEEEDNGEEDDIFPSDSEEYFDAAEAISLAGDRMVKWSSIEMLEDDLDAQHSASTSGGSDVAAGSSCEISILVLVFHGGTFLDPPVVDKTAKLNDLHTFGTTLDWVLGTHYPSLSGRLALRLVPCPPICAEALAALLTLCPYGEDSESSSAAGLACCENLAPALLPLLAACNSAVLRAHVDLAIQRANDVYHQFVSSPHGLGFNGSICVVGDMVGGLLAAEALFREREAARISQLSRHPSSASDRTDVSQSIPEEEEMLSTQEGEESFLETVSTPISEPATPNPRVLLPPLHINTANSAAKPHGVDEGNGSESNIPSLSFPVHSLFLFASPLSLLLTQRRLAGLSNPSAPSASPHQSSPSILLHPPSPKAPPKHQGNNNHQPTKPPRSPQSSPMSPGQTISEWWLGCQPSVRQVFNLFYATDPCCSRLEPLLWSRFAKVPPASVARYEHFPLGDGRAYHILDCLEDMRVTRNQLHVAATTPAQARRLSTSDRHQSHNSRTSSEPEINAEVDSSLPAPEVLMSRWWGSRRLDYVLFSPEGVGQFPIVARPGLLHASYWESPDVAAFMARHFVAGEAVRTRRAGQRGEGSGRLASSTSESTEDGAPPGWFSPDKPRERWRRRKTALVIRNAAANHRGNDLVVTEGEPQLLTARFMYGPLDVVALGGEMVDLYVGREGGQWTILGTGITELNGRLVHLIPDADRLPLGLHPVKMVVRGDHTFLDVVVAVVPRGTECAAFSIDGSFSASVSVTGKDPKVRPGAVDVVRHWQDLGFLILYITARPDLQQRQVVAWLARHNFPRGLTFFTEGLSRDPLRQKTLYLQGLLREHRLRLHVGYGSAKDVAVYAAAGLPPDRIFLIGRAAKKYQSLAQILADGYAVHLARLSDTHHPQSFSRPAQGDGRLVVRRGYLSLLLLTSTAAPKRQRSLLSPAGGGGTSTSTPFQRSHSYTPGRTSATGAKPGEECHTAPAAVQRVPSSPLSPEPAPIAANQKRSGRTSFRLSRLSKSKHDTS